MGKIKNESINDSFILLLGLAVGTLNNLYIFPKFITPGELGLLRTVLSAITFLSPLVLLSTPNIFVKFHPIFGKKRHDLFTLAHVILFIGILFFIILAFLFGDYLKEYFTEKNANFSRYFFIVIITTIVFGWYKFIVSINRVNYSISVPNIFSNLGLKIFLSIGVILIGSAYMRYDLLIRLIPAYYLLAGILLFIKVLQQYKYKFTFNTFKESFNAQRNKILNFGMFSMLTSMAGVVVVNIDIIMITLLLNEEKTGIYTIAFFIATVIEIPKRSLLNISGPLISNLWNKKNIAEIEKLYKKTSYLLLLVGAYIFVLIWNNASSIYQFMPNGKVYEQGKIIILVIALAKLFDMLTSINGEIIANSNLYRFNFYGLIMLSVSSVITNLIFIPSLGILGAALASLLSLIVFNIYKVIVVYQFIKIQPFSANTLIIIATGIVAMVVGHFLPTFESTILTVIFTSVVLTVVFYVPLKLLKVTSELEQLIINRFIKSKN